MKMSSPHDHVIDLVARGMTDVDPPHDLRARTLAILPARSSSFGWLHAAAAVSAVCLVAWLVGMRATRPDVRDDAPAIGIVQSTPGPERSVKPAAVVRRASATTKRSATVTPQPLTEEEAAWLARAIPPLPALQPVALPAIQPAALTIAPITVDPIGSDRQIDRR